MKIRNFSDGSLGGRMSMQVCQSLGGDSFIQIDVVNSASASTTWWCLILSDSDNLCEKETRKRNRICGLQNKVKEGLKVELRRTVFLEKKGRLIDTDSIKVLACFFSTVCFEKSC